MPRTRYYRCPCSVAFADPFLNPKPDLTQGMLRGDFGEGDTVIVSAPGGVDADGLRLEVLPNPILNSNPKLSPNNNPELDPLLIPDSTHSPAPCCLRPPLCFAAWPPLS